LPFSELEPLDCARATDLSSGPLEDPWLVEDLWGHEAVGIIGGEPKCCKSFLALDLAVAVASGRPCLRRYSVRRPGSVLLFAAEDAHHVVRERLRGICAAAGTELSSLEVHVVRNPSIRLDIEADRERLRQAVERLQPRLLVLDPFIRMHRISESAVGEVAGVLGYLRALQREFRTAVCLVHHMRKSAGNVRGGQALRGSSELHAWGDSNLYLRRHDDLIGLQTEHRAAASHEGNLALELHRDGTALALRVSARRIGENASPGETADEAITAEERIKNALAVATQPLPFHLLRQQCRMKTTTFSATLRNLIAARLVLKSGGLYGLEPDKPSPELGLDASAPGSSITHQSAAAPLPVAVGRIELAVARPGTSSDTDAALE
jgi:hypothetical protein